MTDTTNAEHSQTYQYIVVKEASQQFEQARQNFQKIGEIGWKMLGVAIFCIVISRISTYVLDSLSN